jgi:hypothetical protein
MTAEQIEYKKIIIDNAVCKRRFHLSYEENSQNQDHVIVQCPHCSVTLFEKDNHPEVSLIREENLTYSPKGEGKIIYDCRFYK